MIVLVTHGLISSPPYCLEMSNCKSSPQDVRDHPEHTHAESKTILCSHSLSRNAIAAAAIHAIPPKNPITAPANARLLTSDQPDSSSATAPPRRRLCTGRPQPGSNPRPSPLMLPRRPDWFNTDRHSRTTDSLEAGRRVDKGRVVARAHAEEVILTTHGHARCARLAHPTVLRCFIASSASAAPSFLCAALRTGRSQSPVCGSSLCRRARPCRA
jgi:hypothetical protein